MGRLGRGKSNRLVGANQQPPGAYPVSSRAIGQLPQWVRQQRQQRQQQQRQQQEQQNNINNIPPELRQNNNNNNNNNNIPPELRTSNNNNNNNNNIPPELRTSINSNSTYDQSHIPPELRTSNNSSTNNHIPPELRTSINSNNNDDTTTYNDQSHVPPELRSLPAGNTNNQIHIPPELRTLGNNSNNANGITAVVTTTPTARVDVVTNNYYNENDDNKTNNNRKKRRILPILICVIIALTCLTITLVTVGIVLSKKKKNDKINSDDTTTNNGTTTSSSSPTTITEAPTTTPTITSYPTGEQRLVLPKLPVQVVNFVSSTTNDDSAWPFEVTDRDILLDQTSPQYEALNWLVVHDTGSDVHSSILLLLEYNNRNFELNPREKRLILERYILVLLYMSTTGDDWYTQYEFLTPVSICNWNNNPWTGVQCNDDGFVSHILISHNNLDGSLPSELKVLMDLEELQLNSNRINGTIPDLSVNWVDGGSSSGNSNNNNDIRKLRIIELHNNLFTGTLPNTIFDIPLLETLDVSNNIGLTGTISSSSSTSTTTTNNNGGILLNAYNLRKLILKNCTFYGTIPLFNFKKLQLVDIDFSYNNFDGTFPFQSITNTTKLKSLLLNNNNFKGTIPTNLGLFESSSSLSSSSEQRGVLYFLESLSLEENQFIGMIPSELGSISTLQYLQLGKNNFNGSIPTEFGNLLQLETLILNENSLTNTLPSELSNLTLLRSLLINNNQLSGTIPISYSSLTRLDRLLLGNNNFNDGDDMYEIFCINRENNPINLFQVDCTMNCGCCTMDCQE